MFPMSLVGDDKTAVKQIIEAGFPHLACYTEYRAIKGNVPETTYHRLKHGPVLTTALVVHLADEDVPDFIKALYDYADLNNDDNADNLGDVIAEIEYGIEVY